MAGASALGFGSRRRHCDREFSLAEAVVTALADEVTQSGQNSSARAPFSVFLLRYVLMAIAAYVILTVSPASVYGLFAGLFVPVGAIACEAAYEVYVAVARGT